MSLCASATRRSFSSAAYRQPTTPMRRWPRATSRSMIQVGRAGWLMAFLRNPPAYTEEAARSLGRVVGDQPCRQQGLPDRGECVDQALGGVVRGNAGVAVVGEEPRRIGRDRLQRQARV